LPNKRKTTKGSSEKLKCKKAKTDEKPTAQLPTCKNQRWREREREREREGERERAIEQVVECAKEYSQKSGVNEIRANWRWFR
jgi:hypothetical protein